MLDNLLAMSLPAAREASEKILEVYALRETIVVETKDDKTPVTQADYAADAALQKSLGQYYPILSEETSDISFAERQSWERYWLVDPLDGTKEFLHGTDEFCISIALIEQHQPVFGLLYLPVSGDYYYAANGDGAFKSEGGKIKPIHARKVTHSDTLNVTMSRRHGRKQFLAFVENFTDHSIIEKGSAIKFGLLAEGVADIYPRFGLSSEWDTAAGQCLVEEAGGEIYDLQGNVLQYNTKDSLLNPEFFAAGDTSHQWLSQIEKVLGDNQS
tara:strand:+ start:32598 stop:33410 length:813 start_codon:yes stop_codon:yes gene_type:complete